MRLSPEAVAYRIRRLEKERVIRKYIALSHFAKMDRTHFKLYLCYGSITPKKRQEIIAYLLKIPQLGWLASAEGLFDLMISLRFKNYFEFEDFKDSFFAKFGEHIHDTKFAILTEAVTKPRYYLLPKTPSKMISFSHCNNAPPADIDETDRTVIAALNTGARDSYLELSKKTGLSPRLLAYRKQQLEKKGVLVGYKLAINYRELGYHFFKCFIAFKSHEPKRLATLRAYVQEHKNIIYWIKTIGSWDVELELEAESIEECYKIMQDIRDTFSDIISTFNASLISEEYSISHS